MHTEENCFPPPPRKKIAKQTVPPQRRNQYQRGGTLFLCNVGTSTNVEVPYASAAEAPVQTWVHVMPRRHQYETGGTLCLRSGVAGRNVGGGGVCMSRVHQYERGGTLCLRSGATSINAGARYASAAESLV